MKIYISGPIKGIKNLNKDSFGCCEKALVNEYHVPINPLTINPEINGWMYEDYMREDLKALLDCEAIIMLSGWRRSKGACLELRVAQSCGLQLFSFENLEVENLELRGEEL